MPPLMYETKTQNEISTTNCKYAKRVRYFSRTKRLAVREAMLKMSMANERMIKNLFANEKISVFSRTKGKRKNENITVKIKKNLIMR